jgi:membrane fusion protein (multidrug efflux system)
LKIKMKNDFQIARAPIPTRRMKRWLPPLAGLILVSAIGGTWMVLHANASATSAKADAADAAKKPEVQELSSSDFTTVEARELSVNLPISGALAPLNQATVKSKVAAGVLETLVPEGVKVSRGQVVMRLDTGDLQARLVTQQATQEDAKAKLELAIKNHETNQTLLRQKFISQTAYDTAENSVDIARAALKSAVSQVEIARRALDDATVKAPIDGIISKRFVQPGEKASPDTPLFAMVDLRQMVLEAQVPASEIPRIKEGQSVKFDVEGFDSRHFSGKVARINPTAEAGSRAMTVYIAVNNEDGALRGGMFAKGGITLEKSAVTPLIPVSAIRDEHGVSTVYKIENNKVVVQPIKLGLRNEDEGMVAISSGLAAGAQVIIVKLDGVKAGTAVKLPQNVQSAPSPHSGPSIALKD